MVWGHTRVPCTRPGVLPLFSPLGQPAIQVVWGDTRVPCTRCLTTPLPLGQSVNFKFKLKKQQLYHLFREIYPWCHTSGMGRYPSTLHQGRCSTTPSPLRQSVIQVVWGDNRVPCTRAGVYHTFTPRSVSHTGGMGRYPSTLHQARCSTTPSPLPPRWPSG